MAILSSLSESPVLQCSHRVSNYDRILWYKQPQNKQFIFLGYFLGSSHQLEPGFINKYTFVGNGNTNANLTIKKLEFNDTATYFCAASTQCHTCGASPLQKLQTSFFGKTWITVQTTALVWCHILCLLPQKTSGCHSGLIQHVQSFSRGSCFWILANW